MAINEEYLDLTEKYKNEFPDVRVQAEKLKAYLKDFKFATGIYMQYIFQVKTLKNELLNETVENLKSKLKSLGLSDEEVKKLDKKIDYVNKVIELL